MRVISGTVTAGSRGISGLLVEAYHVPADFMSCLPLAGPGEVAGRMLRRVGSARTTGAGEFTIEYTSPPRPFERLWPVPEFNIWLAASSCCGDAESATFVYQDPVVRVCAAAVEVYAICLDPCYEDAANPVTPPVPQTTPDQILSDHSAKVGRVAARKRIFADQATARETRQTEFRALIRPEMVRRMGLVERDHHGAPLDQNFVEEDASVRKASETLLAARVAEDLSASLDRSRRLTKRGRVSLTEAQLKALKERVGANGAGAAEDEVGDRGGDSGVITVTEEDLAEVLNDDAMGSGLNPEADGQIVNRIEAIKHYCRERTQGELCLFDPDPSVADETRPDDGDDGDDDTPVVEVLSGGSEGDDAGGEGGNDGIVAIGDLAEDGDLAGPNIARDALSDALPTYITQVLDERSVLDPQDPTLPQPGTRLDQQSISGAGSFPSLTLPPGPADVPAFFDFYDLQIAFEPVWQEALDESVIGDAEALYDKFVESGGSANGFMDMVLAAPGALVASQVSTPIDVEVQRHVEIDSREWNALTPDQRDELSDIADRIESQFKYLYGRKIGDHVYDDGLTQDDLTVFNRTREYVMSEVGEKREQAARIVSAARKEVERQAAGKSTVPNNDVMRQLKQRLNAAYPAKYFAANRVQRSVNFGLMMTYRQLWTPTSYQVGELIKSIPLAPKEVRKYSRKTVRKSRRSRKELETNLETLKSETNATTRSEADIVQDAMDKTNFNASANGSFTVGVWSGGGSSALSQDASTKSAETKKRMHEAVVKSAREYRNETKVELVTEESFE